MNAQVLDLINPKGDVTKTTSCANLASGLAQAEKKVLIVDCNPQSSLTISLDHPQPDRLPVTLADMMGKVMNDQLAQTSRLGPCRWQNIGRSGHVPSHEDSVAMECQKNYLRRWVVDNGYDVVDEIAEVSSGNP